MQQGQINVQTENIFPIIKKFLYSDHEIFLRELVSNAVDATQKRKALIRVGELKGSSDGAQVQVLIDAEARTLTIRDAGIGMTADEINQYINEIALSGATEFVEEFQEKYKEQSDAKEALIGHFGLGFYSAFMVADRVDIVSLSQRDGSEAVKWSCDGSPNFEMTACEKDSAGTDIILHIAEDSDEFLEDNRIMGILNKYCKFMPVPVVCGVETRMEDDPKAEADEEGKTPQIEISTPRIINDTPPIWTLAPKDLKQKDYTDFYRTLYPMNFEEPLFQIHLNVDFPFSLTGVLYFPRLKPNMEIQRDKIHLYSQQVFITDNVENIVPDFLTLLHGVIDSPDIPLNVSRSYLQEDGNVKKITSHISKKVSDKLGQMFKKDRPDFESKWNDIKMFIEYGMLMDEKFFDRASKFSLYTDTSGTKRTMEELLAAVAGTHEDKDGNTILLYSNDLQAQHSYVQAAEAEGYTVLQIDSPLVSHLVQKLETAGEKLQMRRVDADIVSRLIPKDDALEAALDADLQEGMAVEFAKLMPNSADGGTFKVAFASMSPSASPVVLTQGEFMRRMKDQQRMGGGGGMAMMGNLPDSYDLVFNANHPLVLGWSEQKPADREASVRRSIDLARLSQGLLSGEELTRFISGGYEALSPATKKPAAKKPVAKKPAAKKPVAEKPAAKKPAKKK